MWNLTLSVFLGQGISNFSEACIQKRYLDATHLIEATDELLEYFN